MSTKFAFDVAIWHPGRSSCAAEVRQHFVDLDTKRPYTGNDGLLNLWLQDPGLPTFRWYATVPPNGDECLFLFCYDRGERAERILSANGHLWPDNAVFVAFRQAQ